ncbi:ABC transporter ATP-binding protein [Glaciimonas sp. PAMC28666]|uniref:ABC transporter ATP-binding protein n=1 Tax=Glaciimonas sp. PAMC28666 TaxID=2807626 RepID=UPI00196286DC|nr:ABC transporter ATP-binding protein [Glaciimonas sp. PAMC28666]QRX81071.1 ABC transporter ATP-binding protein [Glaciimonas sp. PAMC28666]
MTALRCLSVAGLTAFYGASQVLFGIDLNVGEGQCMALLGRNGAGKSTTMKAIAGIIPSTATKMDLHGKNINGIPSYRIARAGLGFVPEDRQVFPEHSVEDNLTLAEKAGAQNRRDWTLQRVYDAFPLLVPLRTRLAGQLSGGEQQMLVIGRALMGNPTMLLLDEPSEGLAPVIVQQIAVQIKALRKAGTTILLAEQNMHFCLNVATHVAVIDKGKIVYADSVEGLRNNDDIKRRYLSV